MEPTDLRATITEVVGPNLDLLKGRTAISGFVLGLALSLVGLAFNGFGVFLQSWLFAWMFWMGVTAGSMALLCLHHTVGGGWGFVLRRFLEAACSPVMWGFILATGLVAWVPPLLLNVPALYNGPQGWVHPPAGDAVMQSKAVWLNPYFFLIRSVIYIGAWALLSTKLRTLGAVQDQRDDPAVNERLNYWGAGGIVFYTVTLTFAWVDWMLSLTPRWISSIIGLLAVASQALSTFAVMLILVWFLAQGRPILAQAQDSSVFRSWFRDLGNLMLATVMLWAYMSFSQYLITYSGNTVEEVSFFALRKGGGWEAVDASLIFLHFFLPFLVLLLGSKVKKDPARLAQISMFIVFMRWVDLWWWVAPTFRSSLAQISPADFGTPLLLGGLWLMLWAGQLTGKSLAPLHDPRVEAGVSALAHSHREGPGGASEVLIHG